MIQQRRFAQNYVLVGLLISCAAPAPGCREASTPTHVVTSTSQIPDEQANDRYQFDAGKVYAGIDAVARFAVTNKSDEAISIRSTRDIVVGCGCTKLVPESEIIEPGSSTFVVATVDTAGRKGRFITGGSITWTAKSGLDRKTHFLVTIDVVPVVQVEPASLQFRDDQINGEFAQELRVRFLFLIDPSTLRIESSHAGVVFTRSEQPNGDLKLTVTCALDPEIETLASSIFVSARVSDPESILRGRIVTARVPVAAERQVDIRATPMTLVPTRHKGCYKASVAVSGRLLQNNSKLIRVVRPDCGKIEYEQFRGAGSAILTITFPDSGERPKKVYIELADHEPISLDLLWPNATIAN